MVLLEKILMIPTNILTNLSFIPKSQQEVSSNRNEALSCFIAVQQGTYSTLGFMWSSIVFL